MPREFFIFTIVALGILNGLFSPLLRELAGTVYQFTGPFVMDSTAAQRDLGLAPTAWAETVRATAEDNSPAP